MHIQWIEKGIKPSLHPAFHSCKKTKIGEYDDLGDLEDIVECRLYVPCSIPKNKHSAYLSDKAKHLRSFGIDSQII